MHSGLEARHTVASVFVIVSRAVALVVLNLFCRVVALVTGLEDTGAADARVSTSLTCSLRHVDLCGWAWVVGLLIGKGVLVAVV